MKKTLLQRLGLLGVVSFLSYTAAVVFAPLAYPGYNWMAQAVSDLSAANAPSLALWNQLSALYNMCEVVCVTVVCIGIQGRKTKLLRSGIYLFAVMEWISAVGYRMFPLSDSGYAGAFQDVMHMAVTRIAGDHHRRRSQEQKLPFLRCVRRCRIGHDACGCNGDKNRPCRIFRRGRALQRVCGYGLQRGAGYPPVLYEERNINAAGYVRKKEPPAGGSFFSHICGSGFFSSSSRRCSSPIMSSKAVKSALSTSSCAARSCWDRAAFIVR